MPSSPSDITPEMKVWHVVSMIPKGSVCSYGKVAALAERPGGARWVGYVLRNLPHDTELPWHRVLRAGGEIANRFDGSGAAEQSKRLVSEGVAVKNNKVDIKTYGWPDNE